MASFQDGANQGIFISTSQIFDVSELEDIDVASEEFKQFLVVLTQFVNDLSLQSNIKDTGIYSLTEFINSQVFFPDPSLSSTTAQVPTLRQVFRKVINFGALPDNAIKSVAHGITIDANTSFTRIYGTANDPSTSFIPLPFASHTPTDNIELILDATNVNIETKSDRTGFTTCYVILEYIKQ